MNYSIAPVRREVSREATAELMHIQAKVSRVVGTHHGSPVHLNSLNSLFVAMMRPGSIAHLQRLKRPPEAIRSRLQSSIPPTSKEVVRARVIDNVISSPEKGNQLYLVLGSSALRYETLGLNKAASTMIKTPPKSFDHHLLHIATVDREHRQEVLELVDEHIFDSNFEVILNPLIISQQGLRGLARAS